MNSQKLFFYVSCETLVPQTCIYLPHLQINREDLEGNGVKFDLVVKYSPSEEMQSGSGAGTW